MESFGDESARAAESGQVVGERVSKGRAPGESLYGPGVPTAESFADDGLEAEWSFDDAGPPTEEIPGLPDLMRSRRTGAE